jgi:hypothetical protein
VGYRAGGAVYFDFFFVEIVIAVTAAEVFGSGGD